MNYKVDENLREKMFYVYEIFMGLLALVIVAILLIESTRPLTKEQADLLARIDLVILVIFAADYFYRLVRAKNKWVFFKGNIFDLIAIVPFDKAFRVARLARLVRLARTTRFARFTRVIRLFAFTRRFGSTFIEVLKTNGLIYMLLITIAIVVFGAFGILFFESDMDSYSDALWWSLVTTTTVGYGDISPESTGGRILAGFLMIVRIAFIAMVTASIASYFVDKLSHSRNEERKTYTDEQLNFIKEQLDNIETMSQEDIDSLTFTIKKIWKKKMDVTK